MWPLVYSKGNNKLACYSLMDAWRRPTTAGSEKKMTVSHRRAGSKTLSISASVPFVLCLLEGMRTGLEEVSTGSGLQGNRGTLQLGNSVCNGQ